MDELQHIIEQKQKLLAREAISRPAVDYSKDMTAEEQKRYINYLAERLEKADLGLRARDAVLQDFLDKQKEYDERLSKLDDVLSKVSSLESSLKEKERKLKSAERKVADLTAKLKFADKNRFGDKRQKVKKTASTETEESDRGKDEVDFDSTSSSLPDNSVSNNETSSNEEKTSKKERDLSNRPKTYKTMCVKGPAEEYKSDEAKVPGRILGKKMVSVFHLEMSLETKGILINLRTHLGIEKAKDPTTVTPYLQKALNYLDTFWTNIFAYTKDGSYPIDNNAAERAVRPLTTQRNNMLHFGSDEGAKMAATYHSIISTVKMQGRSAWDYQGKFFVKSLVKRRESSSLEFLSVKTLCNIFNGCRDFFRLRPDNFRANERRTKLA